VEIILGQMLRKIRVEKPGDTDLLPFDVVDKFRFHSENDRVTDMLKIVEPGDTGLPANALVSRQEIKEANAKAEADGKQPAKTRKPRPASGRTLLLGITKASLQSESWLSGASFQETTKVLTESALAGRRDELVGLKENVLLGHLVPAGTGFKPYVKLKVRKLAEPVAAPKPTERQLMAEAAAAAEAAGAEAPQVTTGPMDLGNLQSID
jgi:DNA-directed RNA polymerase subunit beta'